MKTKLKKRNRWIFFKGPAVIPSSSDTNYVEGVKPINISLQSDRGYCSDCKQVVIDVTCLKSKICPDCEALIDSNIPDGFHKVRHIDGRIESADFWMGWQTQNNIQFIPNLSLTRVGCRDQGYCKKCNQIVRDPTCFCAGICPDCGNYCGEIIPDGPTKIRKSYGKEDPVKGVVKDGKFYPNDH